MKSEITKLVFLLLIILLTLLLKKYKNVEGFGIMQKRLRARRQALLRARRRALLRARRRRLIQNQYLTIDVDSPMENIVTDISNMSTNIFNDLVDISNTL